MKIVNFLSNNYKHSFLCCPVLDGEYYVIYFCWFYVKEFYINSGIFNELEINL